MIVTSEDICKLIEKLKCGKASGPDGISAESLRFAHPIPAQEHLHQHIIYL